MSKQYRHRRTANPANPFPALEPGELAVNTANRQIAMGDADAGALGVALPVIAVRYHDVRASYVLNDVVVQTGNIYKCTNATVPPGPFNGSEWTQLGTGGGGGSSVAGDIDVIPGGGIQSSNVQAALIELDTEKVAKAGDTMTGHLVLPTSPGVSNAVRRDYVDGQVSTLNTAIGLRVLKAGDTMTGHLSLPTAPAAANAVRKDYVDAADGALNTAIGTKIGEAPLDGQTYSRKSAAWVVAASGGGASLEIADTPPGTATDGMLWWESDSGALYVYYDDGNSAQWVGVSGPAGADGEPGTNDWNDLANKPSVFPPAAHVHVIADITSLQATLDAKQVADATLTGLATLTATAGLVEQTGLDTFTKRLLGVGATTSIPTRGDADTRYAAAVHTHAIADVTNLQTTLNAKAPLATISTLAPSGGVDGDVWYQVV